jgi:hypothetical protein
MLASLTYTFTGCRQALPAISRSQPMSTSPELIAVPFIDRRSHDVSAAPTRERRQFANSHEELTPSARELAQAVDHFKLAHRRRFITYEEMLEVIESLGYRK